MRASLHQVYLVVDGLDECGSAVGTTVKSPRSLATKTNDGHHLNMAFLSRDELPIREQLEPYFDCVEIAAHTHDVQLYVVAELEERINNKRLRLRNLELKGQIMSRLVDGAKGM